ncbi:MAG TPA: D-alanine--D-alanine ligase [Gemmatimonadaceae bacterium]|nr:D-alanine--D-alanine ligase [Gemmatimonadaceae bacterium]
MNITVLLGGTSSERDVSLASGARIAAALRRAGHRVSAVDPATGVVELDALEGRVKVAPPTAEELEALRARGFTASLLELREVREADVVFLALHGGHGEDGTIQALLDLGGVRYTGSGHLASALAMDKDLSKHLFRAAGVRTADWIMVTAEDDDRATRDRLPERVAAELGFPVVVKPSKQGSTVGLSIVRQPGELDAAVTEAFRHDDEVMLERFVPGRELTVGILGGEALPVGEIIPKKEIYDYECKYTPGMAVEEFPARIDDAVAAEVQEQARRAFRALKLRGCARIDFRLTPEGESWCLEANTLPGMTETSLIPQAAAAAGMSFEVLCDRIAQLALETPAEAFPAAGAAAATTNGGRGVDAVSDGMNDAVNAVEER